MSRPGHPAQLSESRRRLGADLFALLGAPAAWMAAELMSYAAQHLMCRSGATTTALHVTVGVVCAVAAIVAIAAGIVAWRLHADAGDPQRSGAAGGHRRRLFAGSGVLLSGIFLLAIVMTAVFGLFAESC